jgi:hypothetical protein
MPTREFVEQFFPIGFDLDVDYKEKGFDPARITFRRVPDSPGKEEEMYEGLVSMRRSICYPSNRTNSGVTI